MINQVHFREKLRALLDRAGAAEAGSARGHVMAWLERGRLLARLLRELPHEVDFEFFGHFDGEEGLFVDIGSQIGQSAVSFRIFNRSYRLIAYGAAGAAEDLRFTKMILGRGFEFLSEAVGRLDDHEVKPSILKMDEAASRPEAIEGMRGTLKRCRPLLMVKNGAWIRDVVRELGESSYSGPWYYHPPRGLLLPAADDDRHLNLFFVPSEKVSAWSVRRLCEPR